MAANLSSKGKAAAHRAGERRQGWFLGEGSEPFMIILLTLNMLIQNDSMSDLRSR